MSALKDSIDKVFQHKRSFPNIFIGGDFNLPSVHRENMSNTDGKHGNVKDLTFSIFDDYGLTQMVDMPTRPSSGNIVDLVVTTNPNLISGISVDPGMSDP